MEKKKSINIIIIVSVIVTIIIIVGLIIFFNSSIYKELKYKNNVDLSVYIDSINNAKFYYNKDLELEKNEGNKITLISEEPVSVISYNVAKQSETGTNIDKIIEDLEFGNNTFSGEQEVTISKINPVKATRIKMVNDSASSIMYIIFENDNTYFFNMVSATGTESEDFKTILDSFMVN